jgi:hypothetical protein
MDEGLDPARWRRLSTILDGALDLPLHARERYVQEACGSDAELRRQVEELLAAEARAGGFLETPAGERAAPLFAEMSEGRFDAEAPPTGRMVGTYRLLAELGEGGMGTVHLADAPTGSSSSRSRSSSCGMGWRAARRGAASPERRDPGPPSTRR